MIAIACRRCGSINLRKNGHTPSGQQKFHCKDCNAYGPLDTLDQERAHKRATVEKLHHERLSQRAITRTTSMSRMTIAAILCCGRVLQAALPDGLPSGCFGPGIVALTALLQRYRLSDRETADFWHSAGGMPISLGSIAHELIDQVLLAPTRAQMQDLLRQSRLAEREAQALQADATRRPRMPKMRFVPFPAARRDEVHALLTTLFGELLREQVTRWYAEYGRGQVIFVFQGMTAGSLQPPVYDTLEHWHAEPFNTPHKDLTEAIETYDPARKYILLAAGVKSANVGMCMLGGASRSGRCSACQSGKRPNGGRDKYDGAPAPLSKGTLAYALRSRASSLRSSTCNTASAATSAGVSGRVQSALSWSAYCASCTAVRSERTTVVASPSASVIVLISALSAKVQFGQSRHEVPRPCGAVEQSPNAIHTATHQAYGTPDCVTQPA